jgi:lipopolysaccharide heptosyltransferase II
MKTPTWQTARNVLAVRLDSLGDVLMTTPALRALRESSPGRRVTLLTSPAGAALQGMLPDLDDVQVYESPWMKATPQRTSADVDQQMIAWMKARRFDAAVIFTVFSQNPLPAALLCYLAGIPLRAAYCRENPYQLLTDWMRETEPDQELRHEVQRQLDLVAALGCETSDERLSLVPPAAAVVRVNQLLKRHGLSDARDWIVIHPGASAPSRRYPPEHFAVVAQGLAQEHGLRLVFTGSEAERPLVESIRSALSMPSLSLAGALDLGELVALVSAAPLLLTNNTGPAHVAAATGTPVVDLYALTNPQHTPWGVPQRVLNHDVPCKYCFKSICPLEHHACLTQLSPATVVAAVLDLLRETTALPSAAKIALPVLA